MPIWFVACFRPTFAMMPVPSKRWKIYCAILRMAGRRQQVYQLLSRRRLMSNAPQLYALYQQLLEQSQLMLRLARQGLWDDLIICETDYVNAVHSLARLTQESEPSTQIQEQLRPTLRVIWTTKAVKRCCKPEWMNWRSWLVNPPSRKPFSPPTVTGGHVTVPQSNSDIN